MIAEQKVLAVISARGGSKGVPRKNIREVAGRPLLAWSVLAALASRYVDRTIVSSDDDEIIAAARDCGAEVPFKRPPELARDDTPGVEPVLHALRVLSGFGIVVLLQPTSPLRTADDIDSCIEQLAASDADACVSVCEAECHPYLAYERLADGRLQSFFAEKSVGDMRRQDFPVAFRLNGAVYAARAAQLIRTRTFIGAHTVGYRMPAARSLDIDTFEDLALADAALRGMLESHTPGNLS